MSKTASQLTHYSVALKNRQELTYTVLSDSSPRPNLRFKLSALRPSFGKTVETVSTCQNSLILDPLHCDSKNGQELTDTAQSDSSPRPNLKFKLSVLRPSFGKTVETVSTCLNSLILDPLQCDLKKNRQELTYTVLSDSSPRPNLRFKLSTMRPCFGKTVEILLTGQNSLMLYP
jgi:hypothetical protein